jgi:hypothetical protein
MRGRPFFRSPLKICEKPIEPSGFDIKLAHFKKNLDYCENIL